MTLQSKNEKDTVHYNNKKFNVTNLNTFMLDLLIELWVLLFTCFISIGFNHLFCQLIFWLDFFDKFVFIVSFDDWSIDWLIDWVYRIFYFFIFLQYRKINKCYKGGSSPIVIHCSDGVDRSGAYCLIDLVLNRMAKGVKEIDIAATLEHLRDQRVDMVRTKEQFEFVLTAVAQEIQAILKSMPQK